MKLNEKNTLGEWASQFGNASLIFIKHDLDFCCNGNKTLFDACEKKNLEPLKVIEEINSSASPSVINWNELSEVEIVDNLLERYHEEHRKDLPVLSELSRRVETVHNETKE